MENITDTDTYLRRKFRQDVTDKTTGVGVETLKKILAEIVAAGKAGARSRLLAAEGNLQPDDVMAWLIENDGIDFLTKGAESMGKQRLLGRKAIPMAARAVSFYCSPDAAVMFKGQKPSH